MTGLRAGVVVVVLAAWVLASGCGGGGGGDGAGNGGARTLRVDLGDGDTPAGPVQLRSTSCRFDGDRQLLASGVARNVGDKDSSYVNVSVRFVDADGVRVDLASDSLSDLQRGESARWSASVYVDAPDDVVACIVTTTSS